MTWTPDDFQYLRHVSRSLARGNKENARILLVERYGTGVGERIYKDECFRGLAAHHGTRRLGMGGPPPNENCSKRELEILALGAEGLTSAAIGARLLIAMDTVRTHKKQIFQKLAANNMAHAVAIGYETGLLPLEKDK